MEIDIIILFFNKVDQTISCIKSFLPSGQNIYVLNNGSDPSQLMRLQQIFLGNEKVKLMDGGRNLGVSGGRNFLIQHTKADWIFSVDNDITIQQQDQWLQGFFDFIQQHPEASVVAPLLYNIHEHAYSPQLKVVVENNRMHIETGQYPVSNCFPGGASLIRRSVFDIYGLFDEEMFVGFEDYEYALRAMLSTNGAYQVYHLSDIVLIHDHQYQHRSTDKKAVRQRYNYEIMKASYNRLVQKYEIEFDHEWMWWTNNQVTAMTVTPLLRCLKNTLRRILSR